jgi:single stranded DNA-binding protein
MAGMNACVFSGNLTRDPESREVKEKTVAKFGIAVNGFKEDQVLFLECEYWNSGKVLEYLSKGTGVIVSGDIRLDKWTSREGEPRQTLVLRVVNLTLMPSGKKQASRPADDADERQAEPEVGEIPW